MSTTPPNIEREELRKKIEFHITAEHGLCAPSLLDAILADVEQAVTSTLQTLKQGFDGPLTADHARILLNAIEERLATPHQKEEGGE